MNTEVIADARGVGEVHNYVYRGDGVGVSWYYDHAGPYQDEPVRTETLLRQGTVWAGVNLIAGDLGQIPFGIVRETDSGQEEAPNHPIARLLRDGPNDWQTIDQWIEWMFSTSIIWGNGISEIVRERGNVAALNPIPPVFVEWHVDKGEPFYYVTPPDRDPYMLRMQDVIHLKTLSTTGFWGLRLAEVAYSELTLEKSTKRHAANVFKNGAIPGGVLQHPGKLSAEARLALRDDWHKAHGGGDNAGRTAVLWEGMTYNPTAVTPSDAQLIEILSHDAVLVGKVLGVSPYFLGDLRHNATRANLEEESKQYFGRTLRRRVMSLEKELQRKLIRVPVYRVRADPTEFLKGDLATQVEVAAAAVQSRIWTRNEARRYVNKNPVEGGDVFENPAIDTADSNGPEPPADSETEELAAARSVRRYEAAKLSQAVTTSKDFLGFAERFYAKLGEIIQDQSHGYRLAENQRTECLYAAGRLAAVAQMADAMTPADMAEALRTEPIEDDARALATYLRRRTDGDN